MQPIQSMSNAASRIAEGELSQRIDVAHLKDELDQLARVLNDTFERLDSAFDQQVRFTSDASYEMRTPLAVIMAKSELSLTRDRSPELYKETIKTCYDSACHMSSLIESLLELSKVDSGEFRIDATQGDLAACASDCVEMLRPLADQRDITIEKDLLSCPAAFDDQKRVR